MAEMLAGRGAVAELLAGSGMAKRMAALWQRAIGKMLLTGALRRNGWLAGAPWQRAIWKMLLARAPQWQRYCWPGRCGRAAAGSRRKA